MYSCSRKLLSAVLCSAKKMANPTDVIAAAKIDGRTNQRDSVENDSEGMEMSDLRSMRGDVHRTTYDYGGSRMYNTSLRKTFDAMKSRSTDTVFFRDGKRRIDYVLAYAEEHAGISLTRVNDEKRAYKREVFLENLLDEGVQIELEDKSKSQDGQTYFLKLHAPWEVLTTYAELMYLKMPIKELDDEEKGEANESCTCFTAPFEYNREAIPDEPQYFTSEFSRARESEFIIKNKDTFFTDAQRSRIVYEILSRTGYDNENKHKVGVSRLTGNGSFSAAFPLHDPYKMDEPEKVATPAWQAMHSYEGQGKYPKAKSTSDWHQQNEDTNVRMLLYQEWARPGCWYKTQPLHLIRKYFGDKVGIYFAWLGFYTNMLIPAAVVGILCFFYGVVTLDGSYPATDICDEKGVGNMTICPLCDHTCKFQNLSDSCDFAKVTYLFDNPATVFFSIFMSFWATSFLEIWKRRQAQITWEWDLSQLEDEEEAVRPEYELNVQTHKKNPVTKQDEPFLPIWNRSLRVVAASSVVLFMLFVVIAAVFGVIFYRIAVVTTLHSSGIEFWEENAKVTVSVTSAMINLAIILILDKVYARIAVVLTNMEQPRTQSDYEDSFTFKMFLFQSINFYSSLIYIAFFKGRFASHPGDNSYSLIGFRMEACDPAGCLFELCVQLAIIMVGKQILNNFVELMLPKIQNWWRTRRSQANTKQLYTRWEKDYDLEPLDHMTLFNEYLEMVIQYGFVTIFVASFPLAPFFALLNNVIEIRLDAYKFVTQVRRPMAIRANNIGAWLQILNAVSTIAVIVNAFVIAYTSGFVPRMVYMYQYSNHTNLTGYIENSLSKFNTSSYELNKTGPDVKDPKKPYEFDVCWYRDYRNPPEHANPYGRSQQYWHVFAARLAFVVVFEHLVFFLTGLVAYIIPDVPFSVKVNMRREKLLAKEALYKSELQKGQAERRSARRRNREATSAVTDDIGGGGGNTRHRSPSPSATPEPDLSSPPSPFVSNRRY